MTKKPTKKELINFSKNVFINFTESELEDLILDFELLYESFEKLDVIDVEDVMPMSFVNENSHSTMFEDNPHNEPSVKSDKFYDGKYFIIPGSSENE